jgi:hypothetical protein
MAMDLGVSLPNPSNPLFTSQFFDILAVWESSIALVTKKFTAYQFAAKISSKQSQLRNLWLFLLGLIDVYTHICFLTEKYP